MDAFLDGIEDMEDKDKAGPTLFIELRAPLSRAGARHAVRDLLSCLSRRSSHC